jgi:transposase InsO family protein
MTQAARELTNFDDGCPNGRRYLFMDRDAKFSAAFRATLASTGVEAVILPPRSPDLNAYLERVFGSLRAECGLLVPEHRSAIRPRPSSPFHCPRWPSA